MGQTIFSQDFCKKCHKYTRHSTEIFNPQSPIICTVCGTVWSRVSAAKRKAYAQELRAKHPLHTETATPCKWCGRLAASASSPFCSSNCEEDFDAVRVSEDLIAAIFTAGATLAIYGEWLDYRVAMFRYWTEKVV